MERDKLHAELDNQRSIIENQDKKIVVLQNEIVGLKRIITIQGDKIEKYEYQITIGDNISSFFKLLDIQLMDIEIYKNWEEIVIIDKQERTNMYNFFNSRKYRNNNQLRASVKKILEEKFQMTEDFLYHLFQLKNGRNNELHTAKKLTEEQINMYIQDEYREEFKKLVRYI